MKTTGEILREARIKQKKTLEEISQKIKIPQATLEAIEKDQTQHLPPHIFVKGFIRNYALELNLDPEKVLAVFRRDHLSLDQKKTISHGNKELEKNFSWSPRLTGISLSVSAVIIILAFLGLQLKQYFLAPPLIIFTPKEGEVVKGESLEVKGKTLPDATVLVNDELISVEFDGSFSYTVKLLSGENIIKIKAVNRRGKEVEIRRHVSLQGS